MKELICQQHNDSPLVSSGWRFRDSVDLTYGQLSNPPSGPASTEATVFIFEDVTLNHSGAEGDGPTIGLAGQLSTTS